jgi:regulator of protease activity HflC (stomatin/prohibitin superfamily)
VGFEKLIDLVVQFLEFFRFCTTIDCYERGIHLRFGKFYRVLEPGIRLQIPFFIDRVITENVVPKLHQLPTQSIATKDDKQIAMGAVICYSIRSIEKAVLEVESVNHAVNDACQTAILDLILASTWDEIRAPEFGDTLTAKCRKRAWKYGIEIESVRFCELALVRTYRTITGV